MKHKTLFTPAAGPAQAGGRAAVPARIGMFVPSGLRAAVTAVTWRATGRRLIRVPEGRTVVLRNGSAVLIRQVRSTDAPLLADGFARLSAASRQMRFLGVKKELSAAELRYFTDVDHHDHEALAALDWPAGRAWASPAMSGMPTTRRWLRSRSPSSMTGKGRGLGTELLAALSDRARQEGIRRFTALADAGNVAVAASAPQRRRPPGPPRAGHRRVRDRADPRGEERGMRTRSTGQAASRLFGGPARPARPGRAAARPSELPSRRIAVTLSPRPP